MIWSDDMELYEQWLQKADDDGLQVVENIPFESDAKGLVSGDCIGLSDQLKKPDEKTCVLVEEIGHYYTGTGNILNLTLEKNRKQERAGRLWAYDKLIGLSGIIQGYRNHCQNLHELAECLGVTEEFLQDALDCYRQKYGIMTEIDGYIIMFEPSLAVIEKI
jgi:hypothetical protein